MDICIEPGSEEPGGSIERRAFSVGLDLADPVDRDAFEIKSAERSGGWHFAFKIARSTARPKDRSLGKVPLKDFAQKVGWSTDRVSRYLRAWEKASAEQVVPAAETLQPGAEIDLPDAALWPKFYSSSGLGEDRMAGISAEAEAAGISPTQAARAARSVAALRVAILADNRTAEAAREALMERPEGRSAIVDAICRDPEAARAVTAAYVADKPAVVRAVLKADPDIRKDIPGLPPQRTRDEVTEQVTLQEISAALGATDPSAATEHARWESSLSKLLTTIRKGLDQFPPDIVAAQASTETLERIQYLAEDIARWSKRLNTEQHRPALRIIGGTSQ
ncbi:hypothetical protein ACIQI7_32595 [Kitasatospora sp. NPDC092039]|uniref:hypothetical protein n=1 Tax=Kitasatospora sp. NPDC092039 TaxID=3364086 RepID=UPI0038176E2B